jgi:hypothetical protein
MTATIAAIDKAMAHPRQVARPVRGEEGGVGGKGGGGGGVLNSAKNACSGCAKKQKKEWNRETNCQAKRSPGAATGVTQTGRLRSVV